MIRMLLGMLSQIPLILFGEVEMSQQAYIAYACATVVFCSTYYAPCALAHVFGSEGPRQAPAEGDRVQHLPDRLAIPHPSGPVRRRCRECLVCTSIRASHLGTQSLADPNAEPAPPLRQQWECTKQLVLSLPLETVDLSAP